MATQSISQTNRQQITGWTYHLVEHRNRVNMRVVERDVINQLFVPKTVDDALRTLSEFGAKPIVYQKTEQHHAFAADGVSTLIQYTGGRGFVTSSLALLPGADVTPEWQEILEWAKRDRKLRLEGAITQAVVHKALNLCGTTGKLLALWPGLKEVLRRHSGGRRQRGKNIIDKFKLTDSGRKPEHSPKFTAAMQLAENVLLEALVTDEALNEGQLLLQHQQAWKVGSSTAHTVTKFEIDIA